MTTQQNNYFGKLTFLSVSIPYIIFIGWATSDRQYLQELDVFLRVTSILLPVFFAMYSIIMMYARWMRRVSVGPSHAFRRGILLALVSFIVKGSFVTCVFWMFEGTFISDKGIGSTNFIWAIVTTFFMSIIFSGLSEGAYTLDEWKQTLIKTEQLEKTYLQNRLKKLKEQVNPHFLFNSLNCLSSLIVEDTQRADKFLHEMSVVYRYLLSSNEESLSSVDDELRFIQAYFHMQRTRYGTGIQLTIDVDRAYREHCIPTLTLQLLVENAIKHNTVLERNPLKIAICSMSDNSLLISNNIVPKLVKPPSARVGLANIVNKYAILNAPTVEIESTEYIFSVRIPLIKSRT